MATEVHSSSRSIVPVSTHGPPAMEFSRTARIPVAVVVSPKESSLSLMISNSKGSDSSPPLRLIANAASTSSGSPARSHRPRCGGIAGYLRTGETATPLTKADRLVYSSYMDNSYRLTDNVQTACANAPQATTAVIGKSTHTFVDHALANGRAGCGATMTYGMAYPSVMTVETFLEFQGDGSCSRCCRWLRARLAH
jgi:hypothetical protein